MCSIYFFKIQFKLLFYSLIFTFLSLSSISDCTKDGVQLGPATLNMLKSYTVNRFTKTDRFEKAAEHINFHCLEEGTQHIFNFKCSDEINTLFSNFVAYKQKEINFIAHGWRDSFESNYYVNNEHWPTEALQNWESINKSSVTCFVDWGRLGEFPYDYVSLEKFHVIVQPIVEFMIRLLNLYGQDYKQRINIVAHSLGTHLMAAILHSLNTKISGKINKFIGLDVASSNFDKHEPERTFLYEIKDFVTYSQFYHTDKVYGSRNVFGHADIFFQRGNDRNQPGCFRSATSHMKCISYFISSLHIENQFYGKRFVYYGKSSRGVTVDENAEKILVGIHNTDNKEGTFIVNDVLKNYPFCINCPIRKEHN